MEAHRRLSVLTYHLQPLSSPNSIISSSICHSNPHDINKDNSSCVFCKIIKGDSPAFKIYEDDTCLCILDVNPLSPGHSLIIPKGHFSCLEATPPSVIGAMCSKVPLISNAVMKATGCDSFNLLVNNGAAAGQVIYHTHIHIIPRNARDCLWASESLQRRPLKCSKEASNLVECIREKLSSLENYKADSSDQGSTSLIGNLREH
ncbi:adenylylsulfatase HINT3 [Heracleum sosnowskyi]|uniref:Adenylylsulfatase HINT3 n=1 Tax=Heracleum sosnowskyi TaxID=360622 RepID=A0AAD8GS48_9APIA|nr:adenylylsulfatase HINT3 [Heracleum sosnowskyi]